MEDRSCIDTKTNFSTSVINKTKKHFMDTKQQRKAKLVDDFLKYHTHSPSYFAFLYSHSPFEYEHCLRKPSRNESCHMTPKELRPFKIETANSFKFYFNEMFNLYNSHPEMMSTLKLSFSQLLQIGLSYCGHQLEVDKISNQHPCIHLTRHHLDNYYSINDDWGSAVKVIHDNQEQALKLKLVSLSDDQTPVVQSFYLQRMDLHPSERD
ncbi:MAG: hypothetical protein ACR2PX_12390 [Endozoicomonas sp.]|uniref:hypothetical protein n=1 Tax=Endozoicomonas sp. TaxID=1892382 RepID=UPI003D9AB98E